MLSIALLAPLARVAPRRLAWGFIVACGLLVATLPANAEDPAPALAAGLVDQVRSLALGKAAAPGATRVEVVVGQLDPRLHLAPCERIEPYLPPNIRLWGKSRIGLRCKEGRTAWNVYLPIVVKVWGRALVVPAGASAGSIVAESDLDEAEVDLAEEFTPVFVDRKLVVGRTLAQALRPGQAVRQASHQVAPVVRRRRNREGRRHRRRLRPGRRRPGADERHRRAAGAGADRERPRRHRRARGRAPTRADAVKHPRAPGGRPGKKL